ncbi:guanylate-binding protein 3-like isoform X2 [Mya arenaria]|nr:guanylate-binding protein 3-like isoform X2 [Mya arenaria]
MCLISTEGENILKIEEQTLEQLEKIDLPCCVVAVAGLYRTGKSYLMNRLAKAHSGFELGDTIESKTKGIWVWCKMHPEKKQTVLILLDTEGLGDVDKGDPKHDNRIFTLAALLSSTLVYNMKGAFDQDAVNKLTFVSEIANNIQIGGRKHVDDIEMKLFLPTFVLVLRDFALRLEKQGKKLTQDEYLEDCLKSNPTKGDSFNKPREAIRTYFPQRKCCTLPAPGDSEVVEKLEKLTFDKLSKPFQQRTVEFVSYVYNEDHKKLGIGKPVNGSMFADLTRKYIETIRNGGVPDVDDTFRMVAKKENEKVSRQALEKFNKLMESIPMPEPQEEFEKRLLEAQLKSLEYLRNNAVHDENNGTEEIAKEKMDLVFIKLRSKNKQSVEEKCAVTLTELKSMKQFQKQLEAQKYEVPGGYINYKTDVERIKQDYMAALKEFNTGEVLMTFTSFYQQMTDTEMKIMQMDNKLSEDERKKQTEESERKMQSMVEKIKEENKLSLENLKKEKDEQLEKIQKERFEKFEKETAELKSKIESFQISEEERKRLAQLERDQTEKKNMSFWGRVKCVFTGY